MLPKQGGVFLLKVQNLPKISAPSAPILAYLYRKYTPKTSFLSFLAPQAKMLSIFARFLSDFAVRNDDFQRENSNPSQIFRSVQISESAKTRGGFLIKGGFSYYNYHWSGRIIIQIRSNRVLIRQIQWLEPIENEKKKRDRVYTYQDFEFALHTTRVYS